MIKLDSWFVPKTSQFLLSECRCWASCGWGVLPVYLCDSEIRATPCHTHQLFVLSLSTLTFNCRFFTARFPPLKNRQRQLQDAICLFVARTFSSYNSSFRRRGTATTCTSLWYALQGQVGQRSPAFHMDSPLNSPQIPFKKFISCLRIMWCCRNHMLSQAPDEAQKPE